MGVTDLEGNGVLNLGKEWGRGTARVALLIWVANSARGGVYGLDGSVWAGHWGEWKKQEWYPFERRLLARIGVPDGVDLQVVKNPCWGCGGSGIWYSECGWHRDWCNRCDGSGFYSRSVVELHRWVVGGMVFHLPGWSGPLARGSDEVVDEMMNSGRYKGRIDGLISHDCGIPVENVRDAWLRLLWEFERETFWEVIERAAVARWRRDVWGPVRRAFEWVTGEVTDWVAFSDARLVRDFREWWGIEAWLDDQRRADEEVPF